MSATVKLRREFEVSSCLSTGCHLEISCGGFFFCFFIFCGRRIGFFFKLSVVLKSKNMCKSGFSDVFACLFSI